MDLELFLTYNAPFSTSKIRFLLEKQKKTTDFNRNLSFVPVKINFRKMINLNDHFKKKR